MEYRHAIIYGIIAPRDANKDVVTNDDLFLMGSISTGVRVNLGVEILKSMYSASLMEKPMTHPILITILLRELEVPREHFDEPAKGYLFEWNLSGSDILKKINGVLPQVDPRAFLAHLFNLDFGEDIPKNDL